MKGLITALGIVILAGAIALPAFAHGPDRGKGYYGRGHWGGGPGQGWQYDMGHENLTVEQRSQLQKLHQDFYDKTAKLRTEIMSKRAELGILLNTSNPDAEKAKALQKEISELRGQLAQEMINFQLEARKIAPNLRLGRGYGQGGWGYHKRGYGRPMGHGWNR
ncbi:MAG: periplasmic heavy metal sensor [Desulfobacteraceae bacterium]|nr:periplasmic heavy metal sensor [Desulfobacteraceae bacterium]